MFFFFNPSFFLFLVVVVLTRAGVYIDLPDSNGITPLMAAGDTSPLIEKLTTMLISFIG
jgi:hypothetical protein